jgi:hypothetical protein
MIILSKFQLIFSQETWLFLLLVIGFCPRGINRSVANLKRCPVNMVLHHAEASRTLDERGF